MAYFPFFIDIKKKKCLVVGGGNIAYQKVKVLLDFDADVTVISKECNQRIQDLCPWIQKEIELTDVLSFFLVVCATNDKELNHRISMYCKEKNILVNAVDQKEDCTFIFPSYIKNQEVIAAFSSSGNSPVITQYLKEKNTQWVQEPLGTINAYLKDIRPKINQEFEYNIRKRIYKDILQACIEKEDILSDTELRQVLEKYR